MTHVDLVKLETSDIVKILKDFDAVFTPVISKQVEIESYAQKLSQNAYFVLAFDDENNNLLGFIAYYLNLAERFAFIPFIGVKPIGQNCGIGRLMINKLASSFGMIFNSIRLEVRKVNEKAFRFYLRNGFEIVEDRGEKWLLAKEVVF